MSEQQNTPEPAPSPLKGGADAQERARRQDAWAKPVDRLKVGGVSREAINLNVEGRRLTSPMQGFGQMWQKTYKVRLSGSQAKPAEIIAEWKKRFPDFWPEGNRFYGPLTGIAPGETAVLNLASPGRMKLSTGIMVIYADEESFAFMTPQGHMFAGMITFSALEEESAPVAQIQVLVRASDPLYEIGCRLGMVHKIEDNFWSQTLLNLAAHFGVAGHVHQQNSLVDPRIQWKEGGNIWHNAAIRSALYTPVRVVRGIFQR